MRFQILCWTLSVARCMSDSGVLGVTVLAFSDFIYHCLGSFIAFFEINGDVRDKKML